MKNDIRYVVAAICLIVVGFLAPHRAGAAPDTVTVQVHVNNIPQIDAQTNHFIMDAEILFWWKDPNFRPDKVLFAENPYRGWKSKVSKVFDSPVRLRDGRWHQRLRYEGMFASRLILRDYPFETYNLQSSFRLIGVDGVVFELASTSVEIAEKFTMAAYVAGVPQISLSQMPGEVSEARLALNVPLHRRGGVYGVKILMPIIVVVVTGLLALLMDHDLAAARISLLATTMLSLIVLQFSTAPTANYLILIDKIFSLGRLLIAAGLLRIIYTHMRPLTGEWSAVRRMDKRICAGLIGALFFGMGTIVTLHLAL